MNTLVNSVALSAAVGEISKQTAAKITDAVTNKADLSVTTQKVVPDQLPVPVVRFKGFYIGLKDPVGQSMGAGDYEILYHRGKNTFVVVRTGVANPDPFSNFPPDIMKYQEGPLQNPFPDRLFLDEQSGELYQFEDGELKKITNFGDFMKSSEYEIMAAEEAVAMVQQAFAANNEDQ